MMFLYGETKIKLYKLQTSFLVLILTCLVTSCKNSINDDGQLTDVKFVDITFFNESSYNLKIHHDSFDGPVLLELPASSKAESISINIKDNNVIHIVFSIEYIRIIQIIDELNAEIKEVPISVIDPSLQILCVIEADKPYTIQVPNPNPENLEFKSAYITILNSNNLPCVLRYYGSIQNQIDNNNISIAPFKSGIYKNRYVLPIEGELYQGYFVDSILVPEFIMKNGVIYHFEYNGTTVKKREKKFEQAIIFS